MKRSSIVRLCKSAHHFGARFIALVSAHTLALKLGSFLINANSKCNRHTAMPNILINNVQTPKFDYSFSNSCHANALSISIF